MLTGDLSQSRPELDFDVGERPLAGALGGAVLTYDATGSGAQRPRSVLAGEDRPAATLRG
jgi:hypothetical protein